MPVTGGFTREPYSSGSSIRRNARNRPAGRPLTGGMDPVSTRFISKGDIVAVAGLVMLAITVLGLGVLTSKTVKEVHLMRDAEMTAVRWARLFEDRRDDLMSLFRDKQTADHVDSLIWNSHEVGRVIAYDLYDANGRRFYSTGAADWLPGEMSGAMLNSPVTRRHSAAGMPKIGRAHV